MPADDVANDRLTLIPDPRLAALAPVLTERMNAAAAALGVANFRSVLHPLAVRALENGFDDIGADEGVVWVLDDDGRELAAVFRVGSAIAEGRLPAAEGLLGMALAAQHAFCENKLKTGDDSSGADGQSFAAMMAAPFYVAGCAKGVIAAYRARPDEAAKDVTGFTDQDVRNVELLAGLVGRLIDHELLCRVTGWEGI
jgi:GAF domain